ncbi:MAG: hypothetical protein O7J95_19245, partial [Planctomycetota bacterium]|nr:hypothetical protein [Planctomycetota bacterium]
MKLMMPFTDGGSWTAFDTRIQHDRQVGPTVCLSERYRMGPRETSCGRWEMIVFALGVEWRRLA